MVNTVDSNRQLEGALHYDPVAYCLRTAGIHERLPAFSPTAKCSCRYATTTEGAESVDRQGTARDVPLIELVSGEGERRTKCHSCGAYPESLSLRDA